MGALIIEGFDKYQDRLGHGQVDHLWLNEWISNGNAVQGFAPGAYGGQAIFLGQNCGLFKNLGPNISQAIFGLRFMSLQLGVFVVSFMDILTPQISVFVDAVGKIEVIRGGVGGPVLQTSSQNVTNNVWHYLEGKFTINNTTGTYDIYLDGAHIMTGTNQNTRSTANNYCNVFQFLCTNNGSSTYVDDLYVFDTTGSVNNDVVGDSIVETQWPNSDDTTQMTIGADSFGATLPLFTENAGGNVMYLRQFTPPANCVINSTSFIPNSTAGGTKCKGVIYTDASGIPGTLISSGVETLGMTNLVPLNLTLTSPQNLTGGTPYWLGYITDSGHRFWKQSNGGTAAVVAANTYTSGAPGTAPAMSVASDLCIWGNITSTAHWTAVQDAVNVPLTHYIVNTNVGDADLFGFPALATIPQNVWAIKVSAFCQKTDAGDRTINLQVKSGATVDNGINPNIPAVASFAYLSSIWNTDPNTGLAWANATTNAAKSGIQVAT